MRPSYPDPDRTKIRTFPQLKKALKEYAEEYLHQRFTWKQASAWIEEMLKEHLEDIVLSALGFEYDDNNWNRGHRGWKLASHGKERGIHKVLTEMAEHLADKHLPKLVKKFEPELTKRFDTQKFLKNLAQEYDEAIQTAVWEKLKEWVYEKAQSDVDKLFDAKGEELVEMVKLKHPLTMGALTLVANEDET